MKQPKLVRDLLDNRDAILSFILLLTRDSDAAEEVFQEVSFQVIEEGMKGVEVASFLPWVRQVARHRLADFYRRASKAGPLGPVSDSLVSTISEAFDENDISAAENRGREKSLEKCLGKLPRRMREAIEYRYREGLPLGRIASTMGYAAASVKVVLCRARSLLTECIHREMRAVEGA